MRMHNARARISTIIASSMYVQAVGKIRDFMAHGIRMETRKYLLIKRTSAVFLRTACCLTSREFIEIVSLLSRSSRNRFYPHASNALHVFITFYYVCIVRRVLVSFSRNVKKRKKGNKKVQRTDETASAVSRTPETAVYASRLNLRVAERLDYIIVESKIWIQ